MRTKRRKKPKHAVTLAGTVDKIIPPFSSTRPEKAQISIDDGDDLYREIRIDNDLRDEDGKPATLKRGDQVEVTIEADGAKEPSPTKED